MVRGSPRMCMATQPAPAALATGASVAETSLRRLAPAARAASATWALRVSIETLVCGARALTTGRTRRSSSSASTGSAPGLVLSPPTSITSAPSETMRRPWATAAPASSHRPPSEKESGVTFSTPMTNGLIGDREYWPGRWAIRASAGPVDPGDQVGGRHPQQRAGARLLVSVAGEDEPPDPAGHGVGDADLL